MQPNLTTMENTISAVQISTHAGGRIKRNLTSSSVQILVTLYCLNSPRYGGGFLMYVLMYVLKYIMLTVFKQHAARTNLQVLGCLNNTKNIFIISA